MSSLLKAAEDLLACIEHNPGGYDYRPYFTLRRTSQLCDADGAVIRLKKAVADARAAVAATERGGNVP